MAVLSVRHIEREMIYTEDEMQIFILIYDVFCQCQFFQYRVKYISVECD